MSEKGKAYKKNLGSDIYRRNFDSVFKREDGMIEKVTKKWLEDRDACKSSLNYVINNGYINLPPVEFLEKLISNDRLSDANWLIVRVMDEKKRVEYTTFASDAKKELQIKILNKGIKVLNAV